jgi:Holliday junction resolvase RusA-like endonuclease
VEAAEDYAAKHYQARGLTFKRDTDGILKALLDADGEVVVLNLYETESAHAS